MPALTPNVPLRQAMATAHVTIETAARALDVDPKTVQRWLAGRTPRPRHRWAFADLVNMDDESLWPGANLKTANSTSPTSEIVAAYAHRADVPFSVWSRLVSRASARIDLLGYAMLFLPEGYPRLIEVLRGKATESCTVRIAVADPKSDQVADRDAEEGLDGGLPALIRTTLHYFSGLQNCDNLSIRLHRTPMYNSVFRFDDEMLVTPHLYGLAGYAAPLLHIQRLARDGIFDNFADHFERIWQSSVVTEHWQ